MPFFEKNKSQVQKSLGFYIKMFYSIQEKIEKEFRYVNIRNIYLILYFVTLLSFITPLKSRP